MRILLGPHPLLRVSAFSTELPAALGDVALPATLRALLRPDAPSPIPPSEELRRAVRDMLRIGGHKPTGRDRPLGAALPVRPGRSCANAVKDSQRTKTGSGTLRTLSVVWGCVGFEDRLARATAWYRELLERAEAATEVVENG